MDFGLKEKDSLLVRSCSCNRYTNQTKHVCKMVLEYGQIFVQKSQIGTYNLEWFKSRPRVFRVRKRHLIATVFRRHRMRHFFSFNPKNKVTITLNEVLEFVFVTEFGTKNVIFVTIVTNRPYNLLIIKCIFRVEKSPWKVQVLMHRQIEACNALTINELQSSARNKFYTIFTSFLNQLLAKINKYQRLFFRFSLEFEPHLNHVYSIRCFFVGDFTT